MRYDRSEFMFMVGSLHRLRGERFDIKGPFHVAYASTLDIIAKEIGMESGEDVHLIIKEGDAGDLGYLWEVVNEVTDRVERQKQNPDFGIGRFS